MQKTSYEERLIASEKARFAPALMPDRSPRKPTLIEMIPMRDAVRLFTEFFLPCTTGRFPVILMRSPSAFTIPYMARRAAHQPIPVGRLWRRPSIVLGTAEGRKNAVGTMVSPLMRCNAP